MLVSKCATRLYRLYVHSPCCRQRRGLTASYRTELGGPISCCLLVTLQHVNISLSVKRNLLVSQYGALTWFTHLTRPR